MLVFVKFEDDQLGRSTVIETVDNVEQAPRCQPLVSGLKVYRSNPYVANNRTDYANEPQSSRISHGMPPRQDYRLQITLDRQLLAHETIQFVASGPQRGEFQINPSEMSAGGEVDVRSGITQTEENGGKMCIVARWALKYRGGAQTETEEIARSNEFSVCAHPLNWKNTFAKDLNRQQGVTLTHLTDLLGVVVFDDWESDSGVFADLDEAEISEKVKYVFSTHPVFPEINLSMVHNSEYIIGTKRGSGGTLPYDQHAFRFVELKLKTEKRDRTNYHCGSQIAHQLSIFRCHRCDTDGVVVPNSGYVREHIISEKAHSMSHVTTKEGRRVTIDEWTSEAGSGIVSSREHIFRKRLI